MRIKDMIGAMQLGKKKQVQVCELGISQAAAEAQ